ncbi:coenzyme Q-binding protein COQ10 homolog, mitochondrial [Erpetoichthys calabaricus]|uniref:Coenzyme Q-binding protein COQ10 homolog, mitochondrial-like n=1 Tax=Erpetoichthys calabaricus TaxID=27687 RepID=A0A8C4SIU6_ERPCA|nr:coenzyme Q-binding protein COQ10 homolog, mitochondrial [Erpetoichthys calabaricus]
MASRSCLLLKALVDLSEGYPTRALKSGVTRSSIRHLTSCGILATQTSPVPRPNGSVLSHQPSRGFLNVIAPFVGCKKMEYAEAKLLGYSAEQMYNVVADVEKYCQFVPWCKSSKVTSNCNGVRKAQLEIGFPPVVERYTSQVMLKPHRQVRAVCSDGSLFSHLETVWRFKPGSCEQKDSCILEFYVSFEFKSAFHSRLATIFFDEVVKQMVAAFERRAAKMYGPRAAVPEPEDEAAVRSLGVS